MNRLIMGSYTDVKNLIISNIKANGQREITGPILQDVLLNMLENSSRVEEITYSDLKALRDGAKLTPSRLYRITDYITTTVQSNTKSARHPFDVIVLAISESELLEQAWAIQHEGDEYFANSNLSDWELWYCLDNDTTRFAWADGTNGKGVIYRMIDEFNNDIPYDFKNIQFKHLKYPGIYPYYYYTFASSNVEYNTDYSLNIANNCYSNVIKEYITSGKRTLNQIIFIGINCYFNSFSSDCYNNTLGTNCYYNSFGSKCYNNILGDDCYSNSFGNYCNNNYFYSNCVRNSFDSSCVNNLLGVNCTNNSFGSYCDNNSFGAQCNNNILGPNCLTNSLSFQCNNNTLGPNCIKTSLGSACINNSLGSSCANNSFESSCVNNSLGSSCANNSLGSACVNNSLDSSCDHNSFGSNCDDNSLGSGCANNSFGPQCHNNTLGPKCLNNSFVSYCDSNSFGSGCHDNSFKSDCYNNTFCSYCYYNLFGTGCDNNSFASYDNNITFNSDCRNNSFGSNCSYIKFVSDKDATTKYNYYQNNHFGDRCQYIIFKGAETASASAQVQNYKFAQGLQGTSDEYLTIDGKRNRSYETYISRDTDGTIKESIIADKLDKIIETTYANLVSLRDSSNLIPGQQYRITDYQCTTFHKYTRSANHQFDIIVTADSESILNEEARAIKHEDDTYFAECDLNAWKIWYCLDNDTDRFAWAESTNGKGVIYRMIDEFGNDCPYDFKNIQFYRQWDSSKSLWSTISSDNTGVPCYTFSSEGSSSTTSFADTSLDISNGVYSNVIKAYINSNNSNKQILNNNCFFGNNCGSNTFGNDCVNNSFGGGCLFNSFGNRCKFNTFGNNCDGNTFGNDCRNNSFISCHYNSFGKFCISNTFGESCSSNTFGDRCSSNTFRGTCSYNSFGDSCSHNSFGIYCSDNSFGDECSSNTFGNSCYYNTFGNMYANNTFGDGCKYNTFGNSCGSNTFGNYCYYNTFGNGCNTNTFGFWCYYNSVRNGCDANSFGNYCSSNSFGNYCSSNSFGSNCNNNSFGNDCCANSFRVSASKTAVLKDYVHYNHFDDGCSYNVIWNSDTTSSNILLKNINVNRGVVGTDSSYNMINIAALNSEQEINVNQINGDISISNISDILNKLDKIIEISHADLLALRDNAQLIPGQQYRIIDYITTTTQENTKSAWHQFDIIVTALDESTLSEEAQAIQNSNDGYFDDSNLSAWKIWYCLDNDTNRFAWAGDNVKVDEIERKSYDSSKCTIKPELINSNAFITPFNFESCVWVDGNNDGFAYSDDHINHDISELIYEWGYFTDDNGDTQLCIYKSDAGLYEEEGHPDYGDKYLYRGVINVDGAEYDYWQKWDEWNSNGNGGLNIYGGDDYVYATTRRIVSNPEAYSATIETEDVYGQGKGVIYRMIDEWNNDIPYDFKNIQYNGSWGYWAYTFNWINDNSDNTCEDLSVAQYVHTNDEGGYSHTCGNIIKPCEDASSTNYGYPLKLNNIVFLNTESYDGGYFYGCYSNTFGNNCYDNTFGNDCKSNTFGNNCYSNTFGNNCYSNTFGNECSGNSFGSGCYYNTAGNGCASNTFGGGGDYNTFGNNCQSNTFGNNCYSNTFGNECSSNTFEDRCYYNTSGNGCSRNTFGINCTDNSFGNYCIANTFNPRCDHNTFGSSCRDNTFGANCHHNTFDSNCSANTFGVICNSNTFGSGCQGNTFGSCYSSNSFGNRCSYVKLASDSSATTKYSYYQNNHFGDGCQYILFKGAETASLSARVQNYNFSQGLQGTETTYLTIDGVRNLSYEAKVAKNSKGEIKIYCEADLIR